ncbi:hypothetical protein FRC08_005489 [Ceratobasidium sp. 394]|nr:hypothetical protein FRC08_005489 [Ceratobasidium sp. 394]
MSTYEAEPKVHALHIPELLYLICGLIDTNDSLNLMKTCKPIFPLIASTVWNEVEAQVLMELVVEGPQPTGSESEDLNNISNSGIDFSRFDVYAPFVRRLRVYGRTARYFKGERRRVCISRAQRGVLLPNLTSITMLTSDLYPDSDALFWLDLFLKPSLCELRLAPIAKAYTSWVSYPATSALLGKLVTVCPTIEKLEFYPLDIKRLSGKNTDSSTGMLWSPGPRPDFSAFTQLRRVTSTISILDDGGLAALGALPRLGFLSIHGCSGESPKDLQLDIPEDSFPSLSQLNLLEVNTTNLPAIMGVKQLVRGLTSLRLSQGFGRSEMGLHYRERWLSRTLPRLFGHTSRLKYLTYNATFGLYGHYPVHRIDYMPLLQALSKIPLQNVSLVGLYCMDLDFLLHLATAFASTTVLRMPNQPTSCTNLPWFAQVPNLRHLTIGGVSLHQLQPRWPGLNQPLETLECSIHQPGFGTPMEANQVARFLLSLWPHLRHVSRPRHKFDPLSMDQVNEEIGVIQAEGRAAS